MLKNIYFMESDKHLLESDKHFLESEKNFLEFDRHPNDKTLSSQNVTDPKKTALQKDILRLPKSELQTTFNDNTADASLPEPRGNTSSKQTVTSCCSRDSESLKTSYSWRKKGHKRLHRMMYILAAYTAGILLISGFRVVNSRADRSGDSRLKLSDGSPYSPVLARDKRLLKLAHKPSLGSEEHQSCIPRSVGNFPGNFFSDSDTKNGGFVIHILIALYMFAAIAIVCDDYFVPSLEHICEDLGMQADVAGATFMAAGSSAPEFMTSVIGVFFAKSDVGVGTIVGSAVFNILFIIGVCGIFAGMVVELTWYPLMRDSLFYLTSVLALYLTIRDQTVEWYEALIMLGLYALYIVIMYFNRLMEKNSRAFIKRLQVRLGRLHDATLTEDEMGNRISEPMKRARAHSRISHTLLTSTSYEGRSREGTLTRSHEYMTASHEQDESTPEKQSLSIMSQHNPSNSSSVDRPRLQETKVETVEVSRKESIARSSLDEDKIEVPITVSEYQSVWEVPDNFFIRCIWVAMCPIKALFFISIPDSRRPGIWSRLYLLSFLLSVVWISAFTYLMVWMVTIAGDALNIPDTVMGLTLLAAGTSVPDCLASVFVARDGYGDMAVSNSLGSNVFDILMCLGLPWVIECARKGKVVIESGGLTYSTLTLLITIVFLLASMAINKWRLTKAYGLICLGTYVIVITLSCLFELNIFDNINPPACPK